MYRRLWNKGSEGNKFYLDHYKGSVDILLRYDGKPAFELRTKDVKRMVYQKLVESSILRKQAISRAETDETVHAEAAGSLSPRNPQVAFSCRSEGFYPGKYIGAFLYPSNINGENTFFHKKRSCLTWMKHQSVWQCKTTKVMSLKGKRQFVSLSSDESGV